MNSLFISLLINAQFALSVLSLPVLIFALFFIHRSKKNTEKEGMDLYWRKISFSAEILASISLFGVVTLIGHTYIKNENIDNIKKLNDAKNIMQQSFSLIGNVICLDEKDIQITFEKSGDLHQLCATWKKATAKNDPNKNYYLLEEEFNNIAYKKDMNPKYAKFSKQAAKSILEWRKIDINYKFNDMTSFLDENKTSWVSIFIIAILVSLSVSMKCARAFHEYSMSKKEYEMSLIANLKL